MNKNEIVTSLAEEIMVDITNQRIALHNIMLKAARLSLMLDMPQNVEWFKDNSKFAEQNIFVADSFQTNMLAAQDRNVSISSANPNQTVFNPMGNFMERDGLRKDIKQVVGKIAYFRAETFNFALNIYTKWQFGNIAESIFESKRKRVEPVLRDIFPDSHQRLNSIEQNIASDNPEDWKNAVTSCRTLLMDLADILNPATSPDEKDKYINRLKNFVSPKIDSKTKRSLLVTLTEELKTRIELTSDSTQGSAHQIRPTIDQSKDIVLYTYLLISELLVIYSLRKSNEFEKAAS